LRHRFSANIFLDRNETFLCSTRNGRVLSTSRREPDQLPDLLHLRSRNDGATDWRPGRVLLSLETAACAPMIAANILGLAPIPGRVRALYQPPIWRASRKQSPRLWISPARRRMASTLPRMPIFEAIASHNLRSTAIVHSPSGRSFSYGELAHDVAASVEDLKRHARGRSLDGERIAFLVENGYDYVGANRRLSR
jgi:hypothetical protein